MGKKKLDEEKRAIEFTWGERLYTEVIDGNIELSEITPEEVKLAINRAVGKYAFYGAIRSDVKRHEAEAQANYDLWEAHKYAGLENDDTEEGGKKSKHRDGQEEQADSRQRG